MGEPTTVGFELRLDLNASVSPSSVPLFSEGDPNQMTRANLRGLTASIREAHRQRPHVGIQVEAELEPYRGGRLLVVRPLG